MTAEIENTAPVVDSRIIIYHGLESEAFPSEVKKKGDLLYVLQEDTFENQLKLIRDQEYKVVINENNVRVSKKGSGLGRREEKKRMKDITVKLTFDDGHVTNYTLAYPLLLKYGYKACFFVTTGFLNRKYYMSDAMLKELDNKGMIVGSHGVSHRFLTDLSDDEVYQELDSSKKYIEDKTGHPVDTFSAPGGRIDERVTGLAVKAGYTDIYISDNRPGFSVEGVSIHGRIAVKRNYDLNKFEKMMLAGESPDPAIVISALSMAKGILNNKNYQAVRELMLRFCKRN